MTPDQVWKWGEWIDGALAALCEIGVVIFVLSGLGAGYHYGRVYLRLVRRTRGKRDKEMVEK